MPFLDTPRGPITLTIEARDALLGQIRYVDRGTPVVRAFERAGLGDPVDLDLDGKRLIVEAINIMARADEVDPQLVKLRDYLVEELGEALQ